MKFAFECAQESISRECSLGEDAKTELLIKAVDLQHIRKQEGRIIREASTEQGL